MHFEQPKREKGEIMKKSRIPKLCFLYIFLGLVFMASSVLAAGSTTIQGRVIGEEDDEGNTTALYVSITEMKGDEEIVTTYYINKAGKGKELFDYVYEMAKITGSVKKDNTGNNIITVVKYEIIAEEITDDGGDSEADTQLEE
jgi:hypothetical protein